MNDMDLKNKDSFTLPQDQSENSIPSQQVLMEHKTSTLSPRYIYENERKKVKE